MIEDNDGDYGQASAMNDWKIINTGRVSHCRITSAGNGHLCCQFPKMDRVPQIALFVAISGQQQTDALEPCSCMRQYEARKEKKHNDICCRHYCCSILSLQSARRLDHAAASSSCLSLLLGASLFFILCLASSRSCSDPSTHFYSLLAPSKRGLCASVIPLHITLLNQYSLRCCSPWARIERKKPPSNIIILHHYQPLLPP